MAINDLSPRVHHSKDEWPKKWRLIARPPAFYTALWSSFISQSPPAPFRLKYMAVRDTDSLCAEVRIYASLTYQLLDNKTRKETLFHFYGWAAPLYSTWESFSASCKHLIDTQRHYTRPQVYSRQTSHTLLLWKTHALRYTAGVDQMKHGLHKCSSYQIWCNKSQVLHINVSLGGL